MGHTPCCAFVMSDVAKLVYLMVEGEERGPFTYEQLCTFRETGLVTPDTMVKEAGEWLPLASVMSAARQPPQPLGRWFLKVSDNLRGPFVFDEVRHMWEEGKIPPDTRYKLGEVWQPLARVIESSRLTL